MEVAYATTRAPTGVSDPLRFYGQDVGGLRQGVATVRVPHDPRNGERETGAPQQRATLVGVRSGTGAHTDEVLVFVHGFDVRFRGAARRAAQLAYDLGWEGRVAFFSWPSLGTYGGDEVRVLHAATALKDWLVELALQGTTVHVLAHSLGARAVTTALRALANEEDPPSFGHVVLVAPDIAADDFTDAIAPAIAPLVERITVYASAHERALHYDLDADSVGDTEEGVTLSEHFDTIDASAVNTSLLGHARLDDRESVVTDIAALLNGDERPWRLEQRIGQRRYWTLEAPPR